MKLTQIKGLNKVVERLKSLKELADVAMAHVKRNQELLSEAHCDYKVSEEGQNCSDFLGDVEQFLDTIRALEAPEFEYLQLPDNE